MQRLFFAGFAHAGMALDAIYTLRHVRVVLERPCQGSRLEAQESGARGEQQREHEEKRARSDAHGFSQV
jgi:hypothetical protein